MHVYKLLKGRLKENTNAKKKKTEGETERNWPCSFSRCSHSKTCFLYYTCCYIGNEGDFSPQSATSAAQQTLQFITYSYPTIQKKKAKKAQTISAETVENEFLLWWPQTEPQRRFSIWAFPGVKYSFLKSIQNDVNQGFLRPSNAFHMSMNGEVRLESMIEKPGQILNSIFEGGNRSSSLHHTHTHGHGCRSISTRIIWESSVPLKKAP